jgi:hypothetical protein
MSVGGGKRVRERAAIWVCAVASIISFAFLPPLVCSMECIYQQSVDDAFHESQAVFIGKAVEEKSVPMSSKGGDSIGYREVRFEVSRAWKLVDRRTVWVRIPAKRGDSCGFGTTGQEYLVYANQMNDYLYVSPMSRTMPMAYASQDFMALGNEHLSLSEGVFVLAGPKIWIAYGVGILLVFIGMACLLLRHMKSRI